MSLPIMHTAIGLSAPFFIGVGIFVKIKRITSKMLIYGGLFMIFCGVWAEIPDIPRYMPEKYHHLEREITISKYADIFFFHGFLDGKQSENRGFFGGGLIISSIFFLIFLACSKTVIKNQKEIDSLKKVKDRVNNTGNICRGIPEGRPKKNENNVFKGIVDIHCHILPAVDDGPKTMEESMQMCRRAVDLGFVHIVATPHLPWGGSSDIVKIRGAYNKLQKEIINQKIPLKLSLGADVRIEWDLIEKLKRKEIFSIAESRYFLLELDDYTVPDSLDSFIDNSIKEGFYPILTHPERNLIFQKHHDLLKRLRSKKMMVQITSSSLEDGSNDKVKNPSIGFLKKGIVDIISSDAHSYNFRLEEFPVGLDVACELVGYEKVKNMVITLPKRIVNDLSWDNLNL